MWKSGLEGVDRSRWSCPFEKKRMADDSRRLFQAGHLKIYCDTASLRCLDVANRNSIVNGQGIGSAAGSRHKYRQLLREFYYVLF